LADATAALLSLAEAMLAEYRRQKQRRAALDYDDLILLARDLLRRPGVAPWVLFKLDGGIDHILIDEAQDTNADQWAVVQALAEEFVAGVGRWRQPGRKVDHPPTVPRGAGRTGRAMAAGRAVAARRPAGVGAAGPPRRRRFAVGPAGPADRGPHRGDDRRRPPAGARSP